MPTPITKSYLASIECTDFPELVRTFCAEMQAWHDHDLIAKANIDLPPLVRPEWHDYADRDDPKSAFEADLAKYERELLTRYEPYPPPSAAPQVVLCVATKINADGNITYEPDFEIINDDLSPEEELRRKKDALIAALSQSEQMQIEAMLPPIGKRRSINMRASRIMNADAQRTATAHGAAKTKEEFEAANSLDHDALRPPEDTAFMKEQRKLERQISRMQEYTAAIMSDVEDLTVETAVGYKIPTFEEWEANGR